MRKLYAKFAKQTIRATTVTVPRLIEKLLVLILEACLDEVGLALAFLLDHFL